MRIHPEVEQYRIKRGPFKSPARARYGAFKIPFRSAEMTVICHDGTREGAAGQPEIWLGWEHVSVSMHNRCPNWEEMSFIKGMFWPLDESVMQFHPRRDAHIDLHPYCLHMWRRVGQEPELPPSILVG